MLLVNNKQLEVMDLDIKKKFIKDTIKDMPKYYPEWCTDKSDETIKVFVENIIAFAHQYRIFKSHNIYDLIHLEINFSLFSLIDGNAALKQILTNINRNEKLRLEEVKTFLLKSLNK